MFVKLKVPEENGKLTTAHRAREQLIISSSTVCVGETRSLLPWAASQSAEPHFIKIKQNGIQQKQTIYHSPPTKHPQVSASKLFAPRTHTAQVSLY